MSQLLVELDGHAFIWLHSLAFVHNTKRFRGLALCRNAKSFIKAFPLIYP